VLHAVDRSKANLLDAGDPVELRVAGNAVNAYLPTGEYLGMVEPRIGLRLARLMRGGNRYSAKLVSASGDVRIMIREEFQHPSQIGKVSFPQARTSDIRAYTRPELVRADDEIELYDEEEEDIIEEEAEERPVDEESEEEWAEEESEESDVLDEARLDLSLEDEEE